MRCGHAALDTAMVPRRWTATTGSQTEASIFEIDRSRRIPALLMTTSTRPKERIAVLTISSPPSIVLTLF
jgi:hypothetical protein